MLSMNINPVLRLADADERKIFYAWMKKQFHPGELKSLARIQQLCARGIYCAYGLWNGETLMAYALLGISPDKRMYLLDYYAVLPKFQDSGWGSRVLTMLRRELSADAILLEVEHPDYAPNPEELAHFNRRIRFYERNGCRHTSVSLNLFGFDYAIMTLPVCREISDAEVRRSLESIYRSFLPDQIYRENVHFRNE